MPSGVRDIQLLELKDTISQLNNTISTQNELIRSLQKMLQERDAKDSERDQLIANLQAQLDYLKTRLFGSTSEIRHERSRDSWICSTCRRRMNRNRCPLRWNTLR